VAQIDPGDGHPRLDHFPDPSLRGGTDRGDDLRVGNRGRERRGGAVGSPSSFHSRCIVLPRRRPGKALDLRISRNRARTA
jgi:hypothetical protein